MNRTVAESPRFRVAEIELRERPVVLRLPFRFGASTLTHCPQAFVRARIVLPDGSGAWGAAAEMLAPKWFDKNPRLSNDDNFAQLRDVSRMAADAYRSDATPTTAFGHFARHHDAHLRVAAAKGYNALLAGYGPALVDRALLDALLRFRNISFADAMRANLAGVGAAHPQFAAFDFDRLLAARQPATHIDARHTIGLVDAITAADVAPRDRVDDGLPETLEEAIARYAHRHFKIKVQGDVAADVDRLVAIAGVLDRLAEPYFVTLDGNEQFDGVDGVAALVAGIARRPALDRLWRSTLFIEQPIARATALDVDVDAEALGKPVIVDESDGTLDAFVRARARGYAGVSSKTCKGLYKSLLNAARCAAWNAAAGAPRYFMSGEDLTTQAGLSVQQDLALVAMLGITHVERNGHHYVNGMAALPAAEQERFLAAHPDLYERSDGAVRLRIAHGQIAFASLDCAGYASGAMPDFDAMQPMNA